MTDDLELRREDDAIGGGRCFGAYRDGVRVGSVWQVFPTFERKSRGKMYVNSRWTSKYPRWKSALEGARHSRLFRETKRQAIRDLIEELENQSLTARGSQ